MAKIIRPLRRIGALRLPAPFGFVRQKRGKFGYQGFVCVAQRVERLQYPVVAFSRESDGIGIVGSAQQIIDGRLGRLVTDSASGVRNFL